MDDTASQIKLHNTKYNTVADLCTHELISNFGWQNACKTFYVFGILRKATSQHNAVFVYYDALEKLHLDFISILCLIFLSQYTFHFPAISYKSILLMCDTE